MNEFLQSMNGDSLYHDSYFINSKTILAVLYRKFLCNEVSILSNNKALSRCIEKYALEMDVPIVCKHISNVLEVGY